MTFPFTAVVGLDEVKLALLLNAVDPRIGGVLLRGDKGSAKSTLARGLARLLPRGAPFVELPVGASEDRVVGTLDLAAVLAGGEVRFSPGLLAQVDSGVLYIDEVNLLPDHLVDVLLDVAASGVNRVERDGFSHSHPSRFVLIGSMNPEEGELRPQLLDRFGLSVAVEAPSDPATRVEAVRRRLAYDRDPEAFEAGVDDDERMTRERVAAAVPARVGDDVISAAARVCAGVGAEGLRGDIVIVRAAAALAALEGRTTTTVDDVRRVAPLALAHRRRRSPFDEHGITDDEIDDALAPPQDDEDGAGDGGDRPEGSCGDDERVATPDPPPSRIVALATNRVGRDGAAGRRGTTESPRGRAVGDRPRAKGTSAAIAPRPTVVSAATRSATSARPFAVTGDDLREPIRVERAGSLVVLAVDASASMGVQRRMEAVKGAVLALLLDAYQRRDRVALVTFRGDSADIALRPTGSVEVARARLVDLPTGGRTPLAAGIDAALGVATSPVTTTHRPLLVLVSDGRATAAPGGTDPMTAALAAADRVRRAAVPAVVVDAEDGPARLGLARPLADAMAGRYIHLPDLSAGAIAGTVTRELR